MNATADTVPAVHENDTLLSDSSAPTRRTPALARTLRLAIAAALAAVLSVAVGAAGAQARPQAGPTAAMTQSAPALAGTPTEAQMENILRAMERLPEQVKNMSPSDPRFQTEMNKLGMLRVNWAWCALKVGQFAVEMALPVAKIVRAFKAAKAAFGSWKAVLKAIRSGHASDVLGPEAVEILDQLTGASGVIEACT